MAARALDRAKIDIAVLQEVKKIMTAGAGTANCGGITLLVKENDAFTIENEKVVGPNVISFKMLTGPHKPWLW